MSDVAAIKCAGDLDGIGQGIRRSDVPEAFRAAQCEAFSAAKNPARESGADGL